MIKRNVCMAPGLGTRMLERNKCTAPSPPPPLNRVHRYQQARHNTNGEIIKYVGGGGEDGRTSPHRTRI